MRRIFFPKAQIFTMVGEKGAESMTSEWMARGKCKEVAPDLFFPNDGMGVLLAQRICGECPVAEACLEYALANHIDHGVWGGASERERRRILRRRRLSHAVSAG
jgi:WhiB family redox-sensing transcriptional regulator